MNLSQFCNIILFSKPAARHTNKDSLLYSTTSTSGGRFASGASAGITLIEVLVAMIILLVGIWTVAVSFPKLLGVVATQEKRGEMAIQAERTLSQLTRYPNDLPLAITGLTADIDATSQPEDPTISDFTITPPNARDDIIEVIGERFTVPAPLAPPYGSYPVYVFRQGLSAPGSVQVYEERDLPGGFGVDPDGTVNFPVGVDLVEINYNWVESGAGGETHHVYRELIPNTVTQVAAAFAGDAHAGEDLHAFLATLPYPDADVQSVTHSEGGHLRLHVALFNGAHEVLPFQFLLFLSHLFSPFAVLRVRAGPNASTWCVSRPVPDAIVLFRGDCR